MIFSKEQQARLDVFHRRNRRHFIAVLVLLVVVGFAGGWMVVECLEKLASILRANGLKGI